MPTVHNIYVGLNMEKLVKYCGLAALLAGAAFCLPNCDDPDEPIGPEPYDGPWKIVPCPEGPSYLNGVFFLNPDLGYAVGCRHILKYDGNKWEIDYVYREGSERYLPALMDVWFSSPDDGWVSGHEYDKETEVSTALLLRYDGKGWKRFEHGTPATSFYALNFINANDGWAAGFGVCHWNGEKWEYISDLTYLTDIYANSPTDVWATGAHSERIYHYDGATWTRVHDDPWGIELYGIWFTSPGHGWAAGSGVKASDQSNVMEYKEGKWRYYLGEPWNEGIRQGLNAVHFSGPNSGWAVGQMTFRWDGEQWWYFKRPPPQTHTGTMFDVFTINENDAWAVGDARTILHYEP